MDETKERTTADVDAKASRSIGDVDRQMNALRVERRVIQELAWQKSHLLPALEKERKRLCAVIDPLRDRLRDIDDACKTILAGKVTTFRLRKPPVKKPKG